ncbi:Uncharacterised protein [Shigella flexneri]|nr:Uncharacterised protein [Shigella flexneri]
MSITKSWSALPCKFSPWVNQIDKNGLSVYLNQRRFRDNCRRIGFRKWAIIPPRAADCIAIFVKQFLQSRVWRKKSGCGEYQPARGCQWSLRLTRKKTEKSCILDPDGTAIEDA